jgi:uncharacterized membrane protein YobD (UPF0266 family)
MVKKRKSVKKVTTKVSAKKTQYVYKRTPLSNSVTIVGLVMIIVFGFYLATGSMDSTWSLALLILGLILFIASLISLEPSREEI